MRIDCSSRCMGRRTRVRDRFWRLLVGLGAVSALAAYYFEKKWFEILERATSVTLSRLIRLYTAAKREFEVTEKDFTAACRCGKLTMPWSEMTQFSERPSHFYVGMKRAGHLIPKSAFGTEGEITEFRRLLSSKLQAQKQLSDRHLSFACRKEDYRWARILHVVNGGGYRKILSDLLRLACFIITIRVMRTSIAPYNKALFFGVFGGLSGLVLLRLARTRTRYYLGPIKIYFSDEGLHLQDPATLSRNSWSQFIGYLESSHVLLLYHNPRFYRVIPKSALTTEGAAFRALVESKLSKFNYRCPEPKNPSFMDPDAESVGSSETTILPAALFDRTASQQFFDATGILFLGLRS